MSLRYEKSEFLTYASCQLFATSNEDRVTATLNHQTKREERFSSFGVFDGHQGMQAADRCSSSLHELTIANYFKLLDLSFSEKLTVVKTTATDITPNDVIADDDVPVEVGPVNECTSDGESAAPEINTTDVIDEEVEALDAATRRDAIICESIRKACSQLGRDRKTLADSGTTVNSLLMLWGEVGDTPKGAAGTVRSPVRVYCSNVGDSRCVMLKAYETIDVLTAPKFANHGKPVLQTPDSQPSISATRSLDADDSPKGRMLHSLSGSALGHAAPSSSTKASRFVAVHLMSEDHKLSLHRERLRITNTTEGRMSGSEIECWHPLPADASAIYLPQYAKTLPPIDFVALPPILNQNPDDDIDSSRSGPFGRRPRPDPLSSSSCHGYMDSPSRLEHRSNSMSHNSSHGYGLGYSTHSGQNQSTHSGLNQSMHSALSFEPNNNSSNSKISRSMANKYFIFDWGYPHEDAIRAASRFVASISDDPKVAASSNGMTELDASLHSYENETRAEDGPTDRIDPPLCYKISFIKKRSARDGTAVGPEALFSRHNTSIMMTRSIGDRYGPRSCISVPEISAYTVQPGSHARFVLASDGFWDVVCVETVRCLGLSDKYKDPRVLASLLAQKAQRRRDRGGLRMDDISVMVVDVNPADFIAVGGKTGGDGLQALRGKEKCLIS